MKKLTAPEFRALFYRHVYEFSEKLLSSQELKGGHLIGVSGGIDSMVLAQVALKLSRMNKIGSVRLAFVHHHTRSGQDADLELISEFAKINQIPFIELHAQGLKEVGSNFEAEARRVRRELLLKELKKDELLWLGHHIDDSYEWSLLQKSRSGELKSSLGIPVRNQRIFRPLMCVTRKQIEKMARYEEISFREDPTNKDTKFDRNFLRQKVVPVLNERYPKHLKHYVKYSNVLANLLHLSVTKRVNGNDIYLFSDGAAIVGSRFIPEELIDVLKQYSNKNRGEWHSQLLKVLKAIDNGKKGPFQLSGGTALYYTQNLLQVFKQGMMNHDELISSVMKEMGSELRNSCTSFNRLELKRAWENLLKTPDATANLPGLILVCEPANRLKTLNASSYDSLFPRVSEVCQSNEWKFITAQKLLETWKNKNEKLPEKLRLVPLWNLSHLFTSQA